MKLRVSQINRCAYCIIYHRRDALKLGIKERKIHLLNAWQEASEYLDQERAALAWAEAVTLISLHHLPDDIYAAAVDVFSEQELVDLNLIVMTSIRGTGLRFPSGFNRTANELAGTLVFVRLQVRVNQA